MFLISLQSQKIVICFKERAKLLFKGFFKRFGTFSHKVDQTFFVGQETWHTTLFCIYYCFEFIKIENNIQMLENKC